VSMSQQNIQKAISELVGCLTDPIIVFPGGWEDTLPEWLKTAITMERLAMHMSALEGEKITGTDAEVCAYLYTASLAVPLSRDWSQIYLYIAGKTYQRWKKSDVPEDIRVESLQDHQLQDLARLKEWLYRQRTKARQERDRTERCKEREKALARKKALQPSLFDFQYN